MRSLIAVVAALAASSLSAPAWASEDTQVWTTANANVKLSDKWRLSEEVVARFGDSRNGLYEIEINTLLGYRIADNVTLWGGYTHNPNYARGRPAVIEHRGRQQITLDNFARLAGGSLNGRLRLEERWRDGLNGTGFRVRPYVKFTRPFNKSSKTALVLTHESFINLNTTSFQTAPGYERMRNLIAISTLLAKNFNTEVGYLNQHRFVRRGEDTSDHVLSLAVSASF